MGVRRNKPRTLRGAAADPSSAPPSHVGVLVPNAPPLIFDDAIARTSRSVIAGVLGNALRLSNGTSVNAKAFDDHRTELDDNAAPASELLAESDSTDAPGEALARDSVPQEVDEQAPPPSGGQRSSERAAGSPPTSRIRSGSLFEQAAAALALDPRSLVVIEPARSALRLNREQRRRPTGIARVLARLHEPLESARHRMGWLGKDHNDEGHASVDVAADAEPYDHESATSLDWALGRGAIVPPTSIPRGPSPRSGTTEQGSRPQQPRSRPSTKERRDDADRTPNPVSVRAEPPRAPALPESYGEWNRAIVHHLLGGGRQSSVFLAVTPRTLAAIRNHGRAQERMLSAGEADADFRSAVSEMYDACVRRSRGGLERLAAAGADELPSCAAFLAASVLAAYDMREDERGRGNAYYKRLAAVLGVDMAGSGLPRGFDPEEFGKLWQHLASWLRGRDISLPLPESGIRAQRFLAFPRAHVLLRRVDVEHLPEFFEWCGFGPRVTPSAEEIAARIGEWTRRWRSFTPTGLRALGDGRQAEVLAQIARELEVWDGACVDSTGRRIANVELLLDFERRTPILYFLARRPSGYPASFIDGERRLEAGDEGWYEQVRVTAEDGPQLHDGVHWTASDGEVVLRRRPSCAIPLSPHTDFAGFVSGRGLPRGITSAVLVHESVAAAATDFLSAACEQRVEPLAHSAMPRGWLLFKGILPRRVVAAPRELDAIEILTTTDIVARGGLRAGRRWAWIRGAPPALTATGEWREHGATVDGVAVPIADDGDLQLGETLSEPGFHSVIVGCTRRIVEIIEPTIAESVDHQTLSAISAGVALPAGAWTLIGACVGDVLALPESSSPVVPDGAMFEPVWALARDPEQPRVILIAGSASEPSLAGGCEPTGSASEHWARVVYDAEVRAPRIGSMVSTSTHARDYWQAYVALARRLTRAAATAATTDGDRVLGWMSTIGTGSWATFRKSVDALGARIGADDWARTLRLRLSDLAHADFFVDGTRTWRVLAPMLAAVRQPRPSALLLGGRTPALMERVRDAAQAGGCDFEIAGPPLGPCAIRVVGLARDLRAVADLAGVRFEEDYASQLCRAVKSVFAVAAREPPWSEPRRWEVRCFDFRARSWVVQNIKGDGAREYTPRYGNPIFCVADGPSLIRMPKRDAVYFAAARAGVRLIGYDSRTRVLTVPRSAPLPERLARIAAVCCGSPAIESGDLLAYDNIPINVAAVISVAVGQPHPGINWCDDAERIGGRDG